MKNCIGIKCGRKRRSFIVPVLLVCGSLCLAGGLRKRREDTSGLFDSLNEEMQETVCDAYFPVFSFLEESGQRDKDAPFTERLFGGAIPLYAYIETQAVPVQVQDGSLIRALTEENITDTDIEDVDIIEAVKRENENADIAKEDMEAGQQAAFQRAEKALSIDREAYQDFDQLVSEFYTVDSTTYIGRDQLNIKKLLEPDMTLQQTDASKPQILIYHTHSQEAFIDSVAGDDATTIIGAGERLAENLRAYGFRVIHHTGKYDVESRDYAYSNAAPALEQILAEHPEIEVVIDLHRDQMPEDTRLVTEIDGRKMARFMLFNGLSRTNKTGEIDYLQNPNLDANLAFSFQMQLAAKEYYPNLTRKIYLKGYRYNMQYREKSLLIELGAQNNTVEEIMNACDPLAHILFLVLSGEA